jgi:hypothetical protein
LSCGACNVCCKLLQVPDIEKPARMLCWWTSVHGGCQRQAEKDTDPNLLACKQFQCLWLASQFREDAGDKLPRSMRPDQTHVMFGPQDREDSTLIYVHVDPEYPDAWQDSRIQDYLNSILSRGGKVEMIIGETRFMLGNANAGPTV